MGGSGDGILVHIVFNHYDKLGMSEHGGLTPNETISTMGFLGFPNFRPQTAQKWGVFLQLPLSCQRTIKLGHFEC